MNSTIALLFYCLLHIQGCHHDAFSKIEGKWLVKKYLPTNNIVALSQDEVDELIGTNIIYSKSCVSTKNLTIKSPIYSCKIMTYEKFQNEFAGFPLTDLDISSSKILLITIDNSTQDAPEFFGDTILKDGNKVLIEFKGVYFLLSRFH